MLRGQLPQTQSCFSIRSALLSLMINKILDRVEILTTLQKTKKIGGAGGGGGGEGNSICFIGP